jgi:hypothetical protein
VVGNDAAASAERLRVSRKGIPKHCLVRTLSSGMRAVAIEKPPNRHLPGFDREPWVRGSAPGLSLMSAQPVRSARLRRSPGAGVKGDPQVERSGP